MKQPGHYEISSFIIRNYARTKKIDIRLAVHNFSIDESMSLSSVRGSAVVYDSMNVLNEFPFRGEEYVEITYTDYYGVTRTDVFFVYSVSDIVYARESDPGLMSYKLNFTSVGKVFAENERIRRSMTGGLISEYAFDIFNDYYGVLLKRKNIEPKDIEVERTDGLQNIVIPALSPEDAMGFLSRKAYTARSSTQSFRFFETRDKYFFVTDEYMIDRLTGVTQNGISASSSDIGVGLMRQAGISNNTTKPIFSMNYVPDIGPARADQMMNELIEINFGSNGNVIEEIQAGAYARKSFELDVINGVVNEIAYSNSNSRRSSSFISERMTKEYETYIVKDYNSIGANEGFGIRPTTFYPDIHNSKLPYFINKNYSSVVIKIYGRFNLFPGDVITLKLPQAAINSSSVADEVNFSGDYLIESISNMFFESLYTQTIKLTRNLI